MDPSVVLFSFLFFAMLASWRLSHQRLVSEMIATGVVFRRAWLSYAFASAFSVLTGVGSMPVLVGVTLTAWPFLLGTHGLLRMAERASRRRRNKRKALVVGGGEIARRVISVLAAHGEYGLEVVGAVDEDAKFAASELGTTVLGGISDLPELVRATGAEVVLVTYSSGDEKTMVGTLRDTIAEGASVWIVPRLFELGWRGQNGDHIWGVPVMHLKSPAQYRPQWAFKRFFDLVFTGVSLLVLSPLLLLIGGAIYLDLGRPILHRQRRITRGGHPFEMLKFRTMHVTDGHVEASEWVADGGRVTRLGGFLRRTSLDELPQLFNVLRGEMSLVGPRPERPHFVNVFSNLYPQYEARHRLPAGLTGWAQIHGLRGDTSIEERAAFDNYYIENWSLSKDMRIVLRTLVGWARRSETRNQS
ncbi:MAG: exopolysaccharide biosynthesis polyprenyl glycosylphosphotransferase [Actinobacteria bacterium]|nr:exopolysaccharide biosynthesis polyprenyl glycosylphosphotransferase [Actinomycetota bacterium]